MERIESFIKRLESHEITDRLQDIYIDKASIENQKSRYIDALHEFGKLFGDEAEAIFSAPGRSEIGGNHTDHQHGEVLAASINDDAIAVVSKTNSNEVNILSKGYDMITISLDDLTKKEDEEGTTQALIRGVISKVKENGYKIGGFNAYVTSNVLSGSGLSSSAAFETLIGTILSGLYNDMSISDIEIAIIGQYAENVYFGKPCGLMDQMACSVGSLCHIDFADPNDPVVEKITFDLDGAGYSLCITDTKGSHADLTPDYAAVPAEMKSVAACFDKEVLNEVSEEDVISHASYIREKCGDRAFLRAIHFYEENKRVRKEVQALNDNDIDTFLTTVKKSGDSSYKYLQNVYTTHHVDQQNMSIGLMIGEMVLGSNGVTRVHGGGFAGTIQAFVKNETVKDYKAKMDEIFGEGSCNVLKIRKYGGIKVM